MHARDSTVAADSGKNVSIARPILFFIAAFP
jgi:hypothetical protein